MHWILITLTVILVTATLATRGWIPGTTSEGFSSKRTKATAIYDWFQHTRAPKYADYRRDLAGESNIVEYEDAMRLFQDKNLTVDSVEKII
jgi:hypothetical protein